MRGLGRSSVGVWVWGVVSEYRGEEVIEFGSFVRGLGFFRVVSWSRFVWGGGWRFGGVDWGLVVRVEGCRVTA